MEKTHFTIDIEQETDGRWIADVEELPGVMVYGTTRDDALAKVEALALRVMADQIEVGDTRQITSIAFALA